MKFNREAYQITLLTLLALAGGCTQPGEGDGQGKGKKGGGAQTTVVEMKELMARNDGLVYKFREKEPYSGVANEYYLYQQEEPPLRVRREFQGGKLHGKVTYYYNDGGLMIEIHYKEGKKTGEAKNWYKSGALQWKRSFKNDVLDGDFIRYKPDGEITTHVIYTNGEVTQAIK